MSKPLEFLPGCTRVALVKPAVNVTFFRRQAAPPDQDTFRLLGKVRIERTRTWARTETLPQDTYKKTTKFSWSAYMLVNEITNTSQLWRESFQTINYRLPFTV